MSLKSQNVELLQQLLAEEKFPQYFKILMLSRIENEGPSEYWLEKAVSILANQIRIIRGARR